MMKTLNEVQDEIIEEFALFDDWMDKYQQLIETANTLAPLPEKHKVPQNLIEGCQSRVWIHASLTEQGALHFEADSDAVIVKGIIALLLRVYDGRTAREILDTPLYFIDSIGLYEHLSPTRSNGLLAMLRQIKAYALAYSVQS